MRLCHRSGGEPRLMEILGFPKAFPLPWKSWAIRFLFFPICFLWCLQAIQVLKFWNSAIFLDCWTLCATDCRFSSLVSTKNCQLFLYLLTRLLPGLVFLFPWFFQLFDLHCLFSGCWKRWIRFTSVGRRRGWAERLSGGVEQTRKEHNTLMSWRILR